MQPTYESDEADGPVTQADSAPTSTPKRILRPIAEIATLLAMLYALATFAVNSISINDDTMRPNLSGGQRVLINRLSYRLTPPLRGDVVAVRDPRNAEQWVARRVVGLPGEEIEVVGNQVSINGRAMAEPYLDPSSLQTLLGERQITRKQYQLGEAEYFLMSDKRTVGIDSRDWGAVSPDRIEGRLGLVYWPPDTISLTKHAQYEEQTLK